MLYQIETIMCQQLIQGSKKQSEDAGIESIPEDGHWLFWLLWAAHSTTKDETDRRQMTEMSGVAGL